MLEGRALLFTVFVVIAVLAGGVAEIVPSLFATPALAATEQPHPYKPLELEGRDIYIREGCYTCHSQMIRTFDFEAKRYGDASTMADSMYDHPFQWGSKRTGPDLAREGGRYPNLWHYRHMIDPRSVSAGSIMPPFAALATSEVDASRTAEKMHALRSVGVPYGDEDIASAERDEALQASQVVDNLHGDGVADANPKSELVALIAYLQRLGVSGEKPGAPGGATVSMAK
jgi:cytochrome c oxidase cbb3-type subunit I/II